MPKQPGPPAVSVIVPNWNGRHLLEKNFPFLVKAYSEKKNCIQEIIVVDDCSTDDSVKFLKKQYRGQVRLIKHTKNRGFSASVNTGVRMAKGRLVCLLNTDVIPEKDFLKTIIGRFDDPNVFGVSLNEVGFGGPATGQFTGGYFIHGGKTPTTDVMDTLWVSGGSGVFSRETWHKLKGLDEALFSPFYWEDVDLGYRAHKRGYKLLWDPEAKVEHKHESIISEKNFPKKHMDTIKERNELLFIWKNITSHRLFRRHVRGLVKRVLRHPGYIRIVWLAFQMRKQVITARKREVKESVLSDEAVFAKFTQ